VTDHTWERVADDVLRLRVPGGWLYQVDDGGDKGWSTPVFVRDPNQTTYTTEVAQ
jgi:hypothetical protein